MMLARKHKESKFLGFFGPGMMPPGRTYFFLYLSSGA
jgi:hypothetical protein